MKKNKTYKYSTLRKMHYSRQRIKNVKLLKTNIYDFFSNPYTSLKAAFFTETSAVLIFFFTVHKSNSKFFNNALCFSRLIKWTFSGIQ